MILSTLIVLPGRAASTSTRWATMRVLSTKSTSPKYPHFEVRQTRWNDNDGFGHINNSIYYQYMDDAVNMQLINRGIGRRFPRFIAENGIQFFRPISFPANIKVGLRVVKLGSSAVTYDVGFFEGGTGNEEESGTSPLAARGKFVHVYIDETSGRPQTIPDEARKVLQQLLVADDENESST